MEEFSINTSQNVNLVKSYASVAERITASIIDYAIMGSYLMLAAIFMNMELYRAISLVIMVPVTFYHLLFEIFWNGQSPGKRAMNIMVVYEDGSGPSLISYFLRWVFRIVDISATFGSVATIAIISGKKNQRIGDIAARTILIRTKQKKKRSSVYMDLPEDYEVQYPQASLLSDKDIRVVREVLDFLQSSEISNESLTYVKKTQDKLLEKMGIQTTEEPLPFLRTVIKDYNYLVTHT